MRDFSKDLQVALKGPSQVAFIRVVDEAVRGAMNLDVADFWSARLAVLFAVQKSVSAASEVLQE